MPVAQAHPPFVNNQLEFRNRYISVRDVISYRKASGRSSSDIRACFENRGLSAEALKTIFRMRYDLCEEIIGVNRFTRTLTTDLIEAALSNQKDIGFFSCRIRSEFTILLFREGGKSIWHSLLPDPDFLITYQNLCSSFGGNLPSIVFALEHGVILTYRLEFPIRSENIEKIWAKYQMATPVPKGYTIIACPSETKSLPVPIRGNMVDPETLEPARYMGMEPEYSLQSLLGLWMLEKTVCKKTGLQFSPTQDIDLAIKHIIELAENSDLFPSRSPGPYVHDFLYNLFAWKKYHDDLTTDQKASEEMDQKYINYRKYRSAGLYPIPRSVLESWNVTSCTRIKDWLIYIGILAPVVSHCKGVNCTYYAISLPDQTTFLSTRHRVFSAVTDLVNRKITSYTQISKWIGVSDRALRYWLTGRRRINHQNLECLIRYLEHHGYAPDTFSCKQKIQPTQNTARFQIYLITGPFQNLLNNLTDTGQVETKTTGIKLQSNSVVCLPATSTINLFDLTQAMNLSSIQCCRIVTRTMESPFFSDPDIQVFDLRNPRSWVLHLIAHLQLDIKHPDVAVVLRDAQFLGRHRSEKLIRLIHFQGWGHIAGYLSISSFLRLLVGCKDPILLLKRYYEYSDLYGEDLFFSLIIRFVRMALRAQHGRKYAGSPTFYTHTLALRFNSSRGAESISNALHFLRGNNPDQEVFITLITCPLISRWPDK